MPTKTKITKEMILNTAFAIVKEKGFEGLTNKEISERLGCSIQPIYYQFKNTDDLKKELMVKIQKYFYDFLMNHTDKKEPVYKQIGINYITFAKKESQLFQILFMTKTSLTPKEFITKDDEDFKELAKYINISTKLVDDDLKEFHIKMWIFTHGLATIVANKTCDLTDEQISKLLSYEFQALMLLEDNPNNQWVLKEGKSVNNDKKSN